MRNPFAVRRTAGIPRGVPAPDVIAGVEFLETAVPGPRDEGPDVALCGIDPQVPGLPSTSKVGLVLRRRRPRPDSVGELLEGDSDAVVVRRVTVDVRPFRDVLESRGGWNVLAQLVRDPSDRVTNAVFRATVAERPSLAPVEAGDVDCDVAIIGVGDTVAGRCRHELGRARLSLTPLLARSERLTRRLAEALARPCDRATRRCLEHALAEAVADLTSGTQGLAPLLSASSDAPWCAVPGEWSGAPAPISARSPPAAPVPSPRVPSPA